MKHKKILAVFLTLLSLITAFSFSSAALTWDGSSAGGSTNAVNGNAKGYVIRSTNDSECVVGYRFSVVNSAGNMKVNKVIDVFRNTSNGDNAYSTSAKFTAKYNKKQLITNKNATLKTSLNTTNCYKEADMNFLSALPNPSGVEAWQAYEANINKVLTKLGIGTTSNMIYGDKVIIEPLFDICLAGEYQALTVSEIAYCGRSVKGGSSDGGKSNGTSSTWGFIANYTNRIWPNKLYTPDGQGLWTAASAIGSSTKATFDTILTKGYGAGIAYNETANLTYTIKFNGNGSTGGSTASMSMVKDVSKNLTANGFMRTGYTFKNWNKKADGSSTSYKNKQRVKNLSSTQGATVNLYAQWTPNKYTIKFNGNGNTGGSTASVSMTYDVAKNLTANGFTKTGHTFNGWNTKADGSGTNYKNKQSVKNLTSKNGGTVTLYAKWTPNKYTVSYNANGGSGAPANQTKTYGIDLTLSSTKPTRTGYTFSKWNTNADGSGTNYNSAAKYTGNKNLTLYAVWTPIKYTVIYNANGGTGAPGNQTKTYGVDLTLSSTKPTRTGYTFSKWNTKADGSGTNYNSEAKYTGNANLTLYAQWTPNVLTICYDCYKSNVTLTDASKGYSLGEYNRILSTTKTNKTIAGTANVYYQALKYNEAIGENGLHNFSTFGLTAPTGYMFSGWKSGDKTFDETTTTYKPTDFTTSIESGDTYIWLTAQFRPIGYTIDFNGNGSTGGSTASMAMTYDTARNLTANGFTRTGYTFNGWNTKADGTGKNYSNQQSVKNLTSKNGATVTLYAKWNPIKYIIKYDTAGGTIGSEKYTTDYTINDSVTIPNAAKTGHTFDGWRITKTDGNWTNTSKNYQPQTWKAGESYGSPTLTAQWMPNKYTVTYNANGGTNAPGNQTKTYGVDLTLSSTKPTRTGYTFVKWNTKSDGTGTGYNPSGKYTSNANLTLYAQWEAERTLSLEAITPNAPYRENTEVITSFNLVNNGTRNCIPSDNVSVIFKVYKDSTVIKTVTKERVVVPANDKNLLYFKWKVPENLGGSTISISGEIVENGSSYGLIKRNYSTCKYTVSATPDTQYEISAPSGFTRPAIPSVSSGTKTWSVYSYENGAFKKTNYGIGFSNDSPKITPAASANATLNSDIWTMKSGYGFGISLSNGVRALSGCTMPSADSYTLSQYAIAKFPEFSYLTSLNKNRTLELVSGKWIFRQNGSYGRLHFTPLWYPDGNYTAMVEQSDLWTPAGMITRKANTNSVTIKGSAYDDWYVS